MLVVTDEQGAVLQIADGNDLAAVRGQLAQLSAALVAAQNALTALQNTVQTQGAQIAALKPAAPVASGTAG